MASAEQSGEALRDYSSPATWGDVEQVRHSLEAQITTQISEVKTQMAEMDGRLSMQTAEMDTRLQRQLAEVQSQVARLESGTEKQIARLETRLLRWSAGLAAAAGVAIIGFLVGILQAVD